jgi:hypothetical protein
MERLPCELMERIFGYSVSHFSELIYQGAVCRLWKKIADESLLWFSLKLQYSVPRNYKSATSMFRLYYCIKDNDDVSALRLLRLYRVPKELTWNPNSDHPPEPPSSLPLYILDYAFQVNKTTVVSQNRKTARELRKWFISYVIYHKQYWKWYGDWMPFFCPSMERGSFIEQVETVAWLLSVFFTPTLFSLITSATGIESGRLFDCLSNSFFFLRVCGIIGYFSLVIYKLFSCYFKNIRDLNRPKESLAMALTPSESNTSMISPIFQLLSWIGLGIWWEMNGIVKK